MKIRLTDIPAEGRDVDFCVEPNRLNERANAVRDVESYSGVQPPAYFFEGSPSACLKLEAHGKSVEVSGSATSTLRTSCALCAEDVVEPLDISVRIILKPRPSTSEPESAEDEDIGFGFYDGKEIDCSEIIEENFILSLPYRVVCAEANSSECKRIQEELFHKLRGEATEEAEGDERLAIFRSLKVDSG